VHSQLSHYHINAVFIDGFMLLAANNSMKKHIMFNKVKLQVKLNAEYEKCTVHIDF